MGIRDQIARVAPWVNPILDYFNWRNRIIAATATLLWLLWSRMTTELSWPVIAALGFMVLVHSLYLLAFPAFIKLINVGVSERPNLSIWKHKKQFSLYEASCLLADQVPTPAIANMSADAKAWFRLLQEALSSDEIDHIKNSLDSRHTDLDGEYLPYEHTVISSAELGKFCEARGRKPEFL